MCRGLAVGTVCFADNFFSSVDLGRDMIGMRFDNVGTA
jgi:hypothetical protein